MATQSVNQNYTKLVSCSQTAILLSLSKMAGWLQESNTKPNVANS